ncbi:MAG: PAS domain-containing protein [Bacteroidales bacterium]|nr:PAS domain-containing protein [Bacteroidales bacterium]
MTIRKSKATDNSKKETPNPDMFPVVGIGASAGGLEALEQFLGNVPEDSGLAYVIVQHLDPTQEGMLPELLQRSTKMNVYQAKDSMDIKPDCVYVIPPNKSMSILKGVLYLFEPAEARGFRLPVDFFFRSLADDRKERSIGLIFSGMGSDGSLGLRAIKENNGIVMVQDPETAKFDSMPRNAINSVLVDIVAPADELPEKLISFLQHIPDDKSDTETKVLDKGALDKIIILLRTHTGNDFSSYKKNTIYRRVERRMAVHKIDKISSYVHFLSENPKEIELLFKELMIGVTNFFRDINVWEKLKESVIPDMLTRIESGSSVRAWVPGCSTGEEAYSLAIVFKEALEKISSPTDISLKIFATDLDNDAVEVARKGVFPANIANDVSDSRLNRFFTEMDEGYCINTEIREMVVFARHNIIMHPPFTKIDLLSCRNLLIYMDSGLQNQLIRMFYHSTNPNGIILLGSSESLGEQSHLFQPLDAKLKIFKRSVTAVSPGLYDFPSSFSKSKPAQIEKQPSVQSPPNIQTLAEQLLIQHFAPVGVLVNEKGDILYISGRTGKYLEPAAGKANMNVFAMLREGLRSEFPSAFRKAVSQKGNVRLRDVSVGTNGGLQTVNVNIQWIDGPEPLKGMVMVTFTDIGEVDENKEQADKGEDTKESKKRSKLEKELQRIREEMQQKQEEMETSQEELRAANEELQSTNEELTTSKEEMQSLNEELQTVNAELMAKVEDYRRVENDMKNLLNSTDIATLFLDKNLNIRRFTPQTTQIFKLRKSDIGRPITDQASDLIYPDMAEDAQEVLRTLVYKQKQIPTKDGRWFSVRIMPYRTYDDKIDGLVITFMNITDIQKKESKLHETEQMQRLLLNTYSEVIIKLSSDWRIEEFNPAAEQFFGKRRDEVIDKNFIKMFVPGKAQEKTEENMKKFLQEVRDSKCEMEVITAAGKTRETEWSVTVLFNNFEKPVALMMTEEGHKNGR